MTLKQEIEATIAAYKEACKRKNLNIIYLNKQSLRYGICHFCEVNLYYKLLIRVGNDYSTNCITKTPGQIIYQKKYVLLPKLQLFLAHQIRLQYLKNLLNTLPNDSDN
jgi:hypothetical protein